MNHKPFATKISLFVIVMILAASIVLLTVIGTSATRDSQLEELARIKEDEAAAMPVLSGQSRLEELSMVKDDFFPVNVRPSGPSRLEELARIKDEVFPTSAHLNRPSRLEELARTKER